MNSIKKFINDEAGVTAIEYGLIAAAIGVGVSVAATALSGDIATLFKSIGTKMTAAA